MQCGEVEIVTDLQYIIKYKTLGLNSLQAAEVFLFPHHDSATNYFIFLFCTQGLLFGHLGLPFGHQGLPFDHQGLPFGL